MRFLDLAISDLDITYDSVSRIVTITVTGPDIGDDPVNASNHINVTLPSGVNYFTLGALGDDGAERIVFVDVGTESITQDQLGDDGIIHIIDGDISVFDIQLSSSDGDTRLSYDDNGTAKSITIMGAGSSEIRYSLSDGSGAISDYVGILAPNTDVNESSKRTVGHRERDEHIFSSSNNDNINAGTNDTDHFYFSANFGIDSIANFEQGETLRFSGQASTDFTTEIDNTTVVLRNGNNGVYLAETDNTPIIAHFSDGIKTYLFGGEGDDSLMGGTGNDVLAGGGGVDNLAGGGDDDTLTGGGDADNLDGGGGNDTASYAGSDAGVTVDLSQQHETDIAQSNAQTGGHAEGDKLIGIENLTGSDHDDVLTGDDGANNLAGGGGNDTLNGGADADTLTGGAGADIFVLGSVTVSDNDTPDDPSDDIVTNTGNDTITDFDAGEDILSVGAVTTSLWAQIIEGNTVLYGDAAGEQTIVTLQGYQYEAIEDVTALFGDDASLVTITEIA